MNKRIFAFLTAGLLLMSLAACGESNGTPSGAAILIESAEDFAKIENKLNGNYLLTKNLTLNDSQGECVCIGSAKKPFTGSFDGGGHYISVYQTDPINGEAIGLFAVNKGSIQNLALNGERSISEVSGSAVHLGMLCGINRGSITDCSGEAKLTLGDEEASSNGVKTLNAGALVGLNEGTIRDVQMKIMNIRVDGIAASSICLGGFAGVNTGTVTECEVTLSARAVYESRTPADDAEAYLGGIAGRNEGEISNCKTLDMWVGCKAGDSGTGFYGALGGAVGYQAAGGTLNNLSMTDTTAVEEMQVDYATISGNYDIGGLIGVCGENVTVSDCSFSEMNISVTNFDRSSYACSGGIVGRSGKNLTIRSCVMEDQISVNGTLQDKSHRDVDTVYAGGLIGRCVNAAVTDCSFTQQLLVESETINGNAYAGGIFGYSEGDVTLSDVSIRTPKGTMLSAHSLIQKGDCFCGGYAGRCDGVLTVSGDSIVEKPASLDSQSRSGNAYIGVIAAYSVRGVSCDKSVYEQPADASEKVFGLTIRTESGVKYLGDGLVGYDETDESLQQPMS